MGHDYHQQPWVILATNINDHEWVIGMGHNYQQQPWVILTTSSSRNQV